jgi:hypothetical protein
MTGWHCRRASLPCPDRTKPQALATTRTETLGTLTRNPSFELRFSGVLGSTQLRRGELVRRLRKYVFATASLPVSISRSGSIECIDRRIHATLDHSWFIVGSTPFSG